MTEPSATGDLLLGAEMLPDVWPIVPGYEILGELGRGGMGVVYRARQENSQQLVALKLIRDSALAGPQERARFRIEAEAAARMRHPNIIQIHEVGSHQGLPYFAMELVEGGGLDQHLAGQPQSPRHAAALLRTLALAIQHAHEQKIVHRDLKPANILMARGEGRAKQSTPPSWPLIALEPKITDFGLAKRLDSESTAWTQDGTVLGTASYMAPEQAVGRVGEIGPSADVYALGAILYELLTGRPPFLADTLNEAVRQVLHNEPVPPAQLSADVPRDLETVCLKCLEKEPGRRYLSAREFAEDLTRFLDGHGVAALPLSQREKLVRLAAGDGYQIGREIGRGPRSTVYHAVHESLNQIVALKVFASGVCTQEAWEARLQRGAESWSALAHPQIIRIQRSGWWNDAPYVVMEHVPQGSIAAGQRYPVRQALVLVEKLADAVGYLHRQGVVHGNLKPSNVLLAPDGVPRIVDFSPTGGLFQGSLPADDGDPCGLGDLAPELVGHPAAEPRPYTDVYGLGLILYDLLTGRPAFNGTIAREVLEQVRSQDPPPPSQFNAEVTPHLDRFCLRCLRKNPLRRYHRAYDVSQRLRAFQNNPEGWIVRKKP